MSRVNLDMFELTC